MMSVRLAPPTPRPAAPPAPAPSIIATIPPVSAVGAATSVVGDPERIAKYDASAKAAL